MRLWLAWLGLLLAVAGADMSAVTGAVLALPVLPHPSWTATVFLAGILWIIGGLALAVDWHRRPSR